MRPFLRQFASTSLLVLSATAAACATDSVPPDIYALFPQQSKDAGKSKVDAGSGTKRDAAPATDDDTDNATDDDADNATDDDADNATDDDTKPDPIDGGAKPPPTEAGVDNGPCDVTGHWLISQHAVEQGLGVKQAGLWWFYYELEQKGSDLKVKKGLACGGKVIPLDAIGATVDWEAAWPKIVEKNSHTGRSGKVTASGADCNVAFDPIYTVLGATTPFYADDSNELPTLEEKAAGDTPGWEDWDADGKPGVSLHVGGIVTGARYTALRNLNDWKGKYAAGSKLLKLSAVSRQDQAVLGATSDLLKSSSVTDPDASLHFVHFAKLKPEQVQGDDQAVCATIREQAPKLTPDANK